MHEHIQQFFQHSSRPVLINLFTAEVFRSEQVVKERVPLRPTFALMDSQQGRYGRKARDYSTKCCQYPLGSC